MQRSLPRCQAARISLAANSLGDTSPTFWGRSPAEYPPSWTDERVRNAVIGKVHRLGLAGRATTSRIRTARPRSAALSCARPTAKVAHFPCERHDARAFDRIARRIPELEPAPDGQFKLIDLTESMCHWPIGDPMEEGFCFCARAKEIDAPYCPAHAATATLPATPRRKSVFQLANLSQRRASR